MKPSNRHTIVYCTYIVPGVNRLLTKIILDDEDSNSAHSNLIDCLVQENNFTYKNKTRNEFMTNIVVRKPNETTTNYNK